jgi:hypothetical protein
VHVLSGSDASRSTLTFGAMLHADDVVSGTHLSPGPALTCHL